MEWEVGREEFLREKKGLFVRRESVNRLKGKNIGRIETTSHMRRKRAGEREVRVGKRVKR